MNCVILSLIHCQTVLIIFKIRTFMKNMWVYILNLIFLSEFDRMDQIQSFFYSTNPLIQVANPYSQSQTSAEKNIMSKIPDTFCKSLTPAWSLYVNSSWPHLKELEAKYFSHTLLPYEGHTYCYNSCKWRKIFYPEQPSHIISRFLHFVAI